MDVLEPIDKKIILEIINILQKKKDQKFDIEVDLSYYSNNQHDLNNLINMDLNDEQKSIYSTILNKKPVRLHTIMKCENFTELLQFYELSFLPIVNWNRLDTKNIKIICFGEYYTVNFVLIINKYYIQIDYKKQIIQDEIFDILSKTRSKITINMHGIKDSIKI